MANHIDTSNCSSIDLLITDQLKLLKTTQEKQQIDKIINTKFIDLRDNQVVEVLGYSEDNQCVILESIEFGKYSYNFESFKEQYRPILISDTFEGNFIINVTKE